MKKRIARVVRFTYNIDNNRHSRRNALQTADRIGTMQIFGIIRSLIYIFMFLIWGITPEKQDSADTGKTLYDIIAWLIVFLQ